MEADISKPFALSKDTTYEHELGLFAPSMPCRVSNWRGGGGRLAQIGHVFFVSPPRFAEGNKCV